MKVLELVDALESHAYSKEEIEKKADKYRQKLLRVGAFILSDYSVF